MPLGITFRETMAGPFTLGVSDPEGGSTIGVQHKTEMVMDAEVAIPNLDAFIGDPRHTGTSLVRGNVAAANPCQSNDSGLRQADTISQLKKSSDG